MNGPVSRNKMKDVEVSALDKDGLITDIEREPDNQDEKMRNAPIDRGWAWVILFGKTFKYFRHTMLTHSTFLFVLKYDTKKLRHSHIT